VEKSNPSPGPSSNIDTVTYKRGCVFFGIYALVAAHIEPFRG
jgi:hypothetical protein